MVHAGRAVFRHGLPRVREWAVWSLPRPLLALWSAVTCVYLAWIARARPIPLQPGGLRPVRRAARLRRLLGGDGPPRQRARGVVKDVYAVWELPIVFLLPGLYALIVPAMRISLTQWRVRRAPVYRRVYTVAAIGIAYGCARMVSWRAAGASTRGPTCGAIPRCG